VQLNIAITKKGSEQVVGLCTRSHGEHLDFDLVPPTVAGYGSDLAWGLGCGKDASCLIGLASAAGSQQRVALHK